MFYVSVSILSPLDPDDINTALRISIIQNFVASLLGVDASSVSLVVTPAPAGGRRRQLSLGSLLTFMFAVSDALAAADLAGQVNTLAESLENLGAILGIEVDGAEVETVEEEVLVCLEPALCAPSPPPPVLPPPIGCPAQQLPSVDLYSASTSLHGYYRSASNKDSLSQLYASPLSSSVEVRALLLPTGGLSSIDGWGGAGQLPRKSYAQGARPAAFCCFLQCILQCIQNDRKTLQFRG